MKVYFIEPLDFFLFEIISKVKPCESGQKRKDKQQHDTNSVTETWINS